jgi:hypothetical protein
LKFEIRIKNLTAEVAEHTEVKMAKGSRPGMYGKKRSPFRGLHQKTSALSASSSFILLSSFAEDPEKERSFPQRRKEPTTAEIREDAERMKKRTRIPVFRLLEENALRSLRALRLIFLLHLRRAQRLL